MFKPQQPQQQFDGPRIDYNAVNSQVKGGQRPARISLIVDLGEQRKTNADVEYNPNNTKHQKLVAEGTQIESRNGKQFISVPPSKVSGQEVAVFADLVSDVVDYGEPLGKQPYRVLLNHSFKGEIKGVPFEGSYPYVEGVGMNFDGPFTFHNKNLLNRLAVATGNTQILSGDNNDPNNMDVTQLLNGAFFALMDKKEAGDKCYVNFKGANPPPPSFDAEGNEVPMQVKESSNTPLLITFDNVTEDTAKFLNGMVVKKIKQAINYPGSNMQKILEPNYQEPQVIPPEPAHMQERVPDNATPATGFDDFDDSCPF